MSTDVIVVGAGPAGLSCAWRLASRGRDVLVLERQGAAGGNARTELTQGFRIERGPHTFMGTADDVFLLAGEAGLSEDIIRTRPSARKRFIVRAGTLHAVPGDPFSFMASRLLSFKGKLQLAGEPFRTQRGEPSDSAAQFFERRFGPEAARVLAGAFINGVYAGDPATLSAPAAFPLFWGFEQEAGGMVRGMLHHGKRRAEQRRAKGLAGPRPRGLFCFRQGMGQLAAGMAAKLGNRVLTNAAVLAISFEGGTWRVRSEKGLFQAPRLVLAVPPAEAACLVSGTDPHLAELLQGIPMAPVSVVHMGYRRRVSGVTDSFGLLAPSGEGARCLGVLFPSRLFDNRAPEGGDLFAAFIGGMRDKEAMDLEDDALLAAVRADLTRLVGLDCRESFAEIRRVPHAIPQLVLGHLERVEMIRQRSSRAHHLELAGNWLRGVGLKDAVGSGLEAAVRLLGGAAGFAQPGRDDTERLRATTPGPSVGHGDAVLPSRSRA